MAQQYRERVTMAMRAIGLCLTLAASGCGVVYTSPSIQSVAAGSDEAALTGLTVDVVRMSAASVAEANAVVPDTPGLPAAFDRAMFAAGAPRLAVPDRTAAAQGLSLAQDNRPQAPAVTRLPPQTPARPYLIGIGDEIAIGSRTEGALSLVGQREGFTVQDNGAIAVPGAGEIVVAGLTLENARSRMLQAFAERGLDPTFSFEITGFNSQRVIVGGAVDLPATVPITFQPLTLGRALQAAGGVSFENLGDARIELYRDGMLYAVPARDVLRGGAGSATLLEDGDVIFVDVGLTEEQRQRAFTETLALQQLEANAAALRVESARNAAELARIETDRAVAQQTNFLRRLDLGAEDRPYAYIAGEFDGPQRFELPFENTASLADALFSGSRAIRIGFADMSEIYVLRAAAADPAVVQAYHLDASNASNLVLATRFVLQNNDVVFIAEQPITAWNRVLTQLFPSILNLAVGEAIR